MRLLLVRGMKPGLMWSKCSNGHDLTLPGAYYYKADGKRECRECSNVTPKKKGKRALETWHEKRETSG